ncbi:MAG: purine-nucleoside phosphorylase [Candidatus Neomarinimicrobiota bacterium]|nr:MAG: purine-nucleoside phosphorylase [Candidatus Neomarinimicrobiota bacterium]
MRTTGGGGAGVNSVLQPAADRLRSFLPATPAVALILGSGLGNFARHLDQARSLAYRDLPGFPRPSVEGHTGEFVFGTVGSVPVLLARGRIHYYEGYDLEQIALPVRLFARLGIRRLIVTNAAGSVRPEIPPGRFMLIDGYLDATFRTSVDPVPYAGPPWVSPAFLQLAQARARARQLEVSTGTYAWTSGPAYETPAEIRFFQSLGAAAVGMSTLPEVLAAAAEGLDILAVSALTNYAAGIASHPLHHGEVITTAREIEGPFEHWMRDLILHLPQRKD